MKVLNKKSPSWAQDTEVIQNKKKNTTYMYEKKLFMGTLASDIKKCWIFCRKKFINLFDTM